MIKDQYFCNIPAAQSTPITESARREQAEHDAKHRQIVDEAVRAHDDRQPPAVPRREAPQRVGHADDRDSGGGRGGRAVGQRQEQTRRVRAVGEASEHAAQRRADAVELRAIQARLDPGEDSPAQSEDALMAAARRKYKLD